MTRILSACMLLALAACAPKEDANGDGIVDGIREPNSVSQIAPSNPIGTLSGVVMNSQNQPIDGVQVTLVLGGAGSEGGTFSATTNGNGAYAFNRLPAGSSAQLLFSKTGFTTARYTTTVPAAAGQFPINDGNGNAGTVTLVQLSSNIKFQVFTSAGRPARGAKAFVEINNSAFLSTGGVYSSGTGTFSATADVDEAGLLTFSNLPDLGELARINTAGFTTSTVVVSVSAIDEDNDGFVDWNGSVTSYSASQLFVNPNRTLVLPRSGTVNPIAIVASNLDSFGSAGSPPYRNAVKGSDPITIVFNQAIAQNDNTRLVKVVGEDCQANVAASVTQRTPNSLSISPSMPWTLGARYNIIVRVTGLESGTTEDFIGYFFAMDPASPRAIGNTARFEARKVSGNMMANAYQPGDTLYVVFDSPVTNQGAAVAVAQVDFDITGDGMTGGSTGFGEFGGPENQGFSITNAEQLQATRPIDGTFTCKASGYSSRWLVNGVTFPPASQAIPQGTTMKIVFPRNNSSSATYQSISGSPVLVDPAGTITVIPSP